VDTLSLIIRFTSLVSHVIHALKQVYPIVFISQVIVIIILLPSKVFSFVNYSKMDLFYKLLIA
jgi:hypothetical protein